MPVLLSLSFLSCTPLPKARLGTAEELKGVVRCLSPTTCVYSCALVKQEIFGLNTEVTGWNFVDCVLHEVRLDDVMVSLLALKSMTP